MFLGFGFTIDNVVFRLGFYSPLGAFVGKKWGGNPCVFLEITMNALSAPAVLSQFIAYDEYFDLQMIALSPTLSR